MTKRLIEEWLPIAEIGEESMRERRSMTALPPIYYLHVWWAQRPLVASRAAVLASHHCAHRARSIDLNAAKQLLDDNGLAHSPVFLTALEAVLEVLPLSARYTGFDPVKAAAPAASDFEALENLRRLALAEQVPAPKQLELVLAELAEAS